MIRLAAEHRRVLTLGANQAEPRLYQRARDGKCLPGSEAAYWRAQTN